MTHRDFEEEAKKDISLMYVHNKRQFYIWILMLIIVIVSISVYVDYLLYDIRLFVIFYSDISYEDRITTYLLMILYTFSLIICIYVFIELTKKTFIFDELVSKELSLLYEDQEEI